MKTIFFNNRSPGGFLRLLNATKRSNDSSVFASQFVAETLERRQLDNIFYLFVSYL